MVPPLRYLDGVDVVRSQRVFDHSYSRKHAVPIVTYLTGASLGATEDSGGATFRRPSDGPVVRLTNPPSADP
jgi:hypothetical protein